MNLTSPLRSGEIFIQCSNKPLWTLYIVKNILHLTNVDTLIYSLGKHYTKLIGIISSRKTIGRAKSLQILDLQKTIPGFKKFKIE